ncbi:MAG: hypothetical protein K8J31_01640 [Anaerolineae bacterium]|nr:hypothetical protein [Anaerolineae bacterium]
MKRSALVISASFFALSLASLFHSTAALSQPPASNHPLQETGLIYYVRPDGGSAGQCTGLVDAPYSGAGSEQPCAWNHPFQALPPGETPRIMGGDTLLIAAGEYAMGYGAPGAEGCDEGGSFDCHMPPIPSGPAPDRPTRILGSGWDSACAAPPVLWGTGRPWFIVNMTDSSHVELDCLEITDHSTCVENHTGGLACERDQLPYGDWASYGLQAEDSTHVHLKNLNIHGLAAGGVHAGRLTDWTVENVRIAGNGSVGWDGDLWDDLGDANTGSLVFRHWVVEWNGCGETYPEGEPVGCWGQEAGGYGDGVGTGETGGDWLIEDSAFLHNTSDGLDLLYHTLGGSVTLNRVRAEGNAGNQIKIAGQSTLTNAVLVGNCAFFEGQPFTYWVDHCRALGSALLIAYTGGEQISIVNSTVYGQGDGLIGAGPREGFPCNGSESLQMRNSIVVGDQDYFDSSDVTFYFYQEGCGSLKLDSDYNIMFHVKNIECGVDGDFTTSGSHDLCADPLLVGPLEGSAYPMTVRADSPAVNSGDPASCPPDDYLGNPRPVDGNGDGSAVCNRGAYE